MSVRMVKHYTALTYPDGTTRINLYFTDGTQAAYTGLLPLRARLILNILRYEKPVYWTAEREILWTGREPVGEGEVAFNLEGWLSERPLILENILWESPGGIIQPYEGWSSGMKNSLDSAVRTLLDGRPLGITDPPPLAVTPSGDEHVSTKLAQSVAWSIFIGHVAQSIIVEASQFVRWSLNALNAPKLRLLFDSRSLFRWHRSTATYCINSDHGMVTPGDPAKTFEFLAANDLVGSSRLNTIERVLDWCRSNLIHFIGGWDASNVYRQWQYYGFPPVKRIIEGTEDLENPSWPAKHRTGGCWGTTGFLRALMRTVNIPVELVTRAGHAQPHFVHQSLYLSHGDDPYNAMMRAVPQIPISQLPINQTTYNEWFGPSVPSETASNNIGRRSCELGLEYLSNWLLRRRCDDISSGASHDVSEVYETLSRYWTVEELEAMDLWTRLDQKIADMGGCGAIPP